MHLSWLTARAVALGVALCISLSGIAADPATRSSNGFPYQTGPEPGWVEPLEVDAEWPAAAPGYAGEPWRSWLADIQIDIRGGRRHRYYDSAFESTGAALLDEAGSFTIEFNPDYETLTIHEIALRRQGEWQGRLDPAGISLVQREAGNERGLRTGIVTALIQIEDVRAGDVIRVRYSVEGSNPVLAGLHHEEMLLGWMDPLLHRQVRLLSDRGLPLQVATDGDVPAPLQTTEADHVETLWQLRQVAGYPLEDAVPIGHSQFPRLRIAYGRSWQEIVDWALPLYPVGAVREEELQKRIEAMRAIADPAGRAGAALRMVQDEVRYFSLALGESTHRPADPGQTWQRRYGDCKDKSRLLVSVLHALGIESHAALVSNGSRDLVGSAPPAATAFDHVIVRLRIEGTEYWVDPTASHQRGALGDLHLPDFAWALVIEAGAGKLQPTPARQPGLDRYDVLEAFEAESADGAMRLRVETVLHGLAAESTRAHLATAGVDEVARSYRTFYEGRYRSAEATANLEVVDDAGDGSLRLVEHYRLPQPWIDSDGYRTIELGSTAIASELASVSLQDRRSPLALNGPLELSYRGEVSIPDGWKTGSLPQTKTVDRDGVSFVQRAETEDTAIRLVQELRTGSGQIAVRALAPHLQARREASDAYAYRLVLQQPPKQRAEQQGRRFDSLMRELMEESQ